MARRVDTRPYTLIWLGNVAPLAGRRGELSSHTRLELAIQAGMRQSKALRDMWGSSAPWFVYQVIDARDGRVCKFIR